jgi:CheY-like chemotaxis protein
MSMLESSKEFDMVLTDVMMPYLDGFGLLKEIRYARALSLSLSLFSPLAFASTNHW